QGGTETLDFTGPEACGAGGPGAWRFRRRLDQFHIRALLSGNGAGAFRHHASGEGNRHPARSFGRSPAPVDRTDRKARDIETRRNLRVMIARVATAITSASSSLSKYLGGAGGWPPAIAGREMTT